MRILALTVPFFPSIGGVQTVANLLAAEWQFMGHEVCVATLAANVGEDSFPYRVMRQPSLFELCKLFRWADGVFLHGLTVRLGWPLLATHKPCVAIHHMILPRQSYSGWLRRRFVQRVHNVAVSAAVASTLPAESRIVPNPFDNKIFHSQYNICHRRDVIFVGRLIPGKGVDVLLLAMQHLKNSGTSPSLTVVGGGPDLNNLRALSKRLCIADQVDFVGVQTGERLAHILSEHRLIVIPSRCEESYGIVALEGIACGCVAVGSDSGGLPEAIGPCGVVFPRDDAASLAECLTSILTNSERFAQLRACATEHLDRHSPRVIAKRYLELLAAPVSTN
jgi:glycogen(starch) synthase